MLNKAIMIAVKAHARQIDKAGAPYIFHPFRVMMSSASEIEQVCGVLHDVIEDSNITLNFLREEGFTEAVIEILDCLTKRAEESYDEFIGRVLKNKTACRIKLADLHDNMDLSRIKDISEQDKIRMEKYRKAAMRIYDVLPMELESKDERIIRIDGCVSIQPYLTHDEFIDRFIRFIESHGWYFGGGTDDITDKDESAV